MKLEPLKNKGTWYLHGIKIHHDDDIKSAVEWLKEELKKKEELGVVGVVMRKEYFDGFNKGIEKALNKIDKAFEDVTEDGITKQ